MHRTFIDDLAPPAARSRAPAWGRLDARAPLAVLAVLLSLLVLLLAPVRSQAAQERYEYDPIGRLVRFIDGQGGVTEYVYDPAGNILAVRRASAAASSPVLAAVSPAFVRRASTQPVTLTGERLQVGTLQASDPGLVFGSLVQGATQITATLSVAPSTALGAQTLTFANASGSARIALTVAPALPTLTVEPSPLALPPDGTTRQVTVRLSHADLVPHTLAIGSSDPTRASASPASITFAPGQTSAPLAVTPKAAGFLSLVLSSSTLGTATVPVFVTSDFRGVNTSDAPHVGLQVGDAGPPPPDTAEAVFRAPQVGLSLGPVLTGVSPGGFPVGGTHTMLVNGRGLPAGLGVAVEPPTGILAAVTGSDAQGAQVSLVVDAAAAPGIRRLVLKDGAGQAIPFADPAASQFRLTTGQPEIDSIEPLFAMRGEAHTLRVRGRHLQSGTVRIEPSVDLRIDAAPTVNAAGTELLAGLHVAALAAPGERIVQVLTPSGSTPAVASPANRLTVVSEIQHAVTPIVASMVGLQVGGSTQGPDSPVGPVAATGVGVTLGTAAVSTSPSVALVGSTTTLTVSGTGLQGVESVSLAPATGVALGAFRVNAEGTAISVDAVVDAAAHRGPRRLVLLAAGKAVTFAAASGDQVLVAAPAPTLLSITPQVIAAAGSRTVVVRGANFSDITAVEFDPPTGLIAMPPFDATEGNTRLALNVVVDAAAPAATRTLILHAAGGSSSRAPVPGNTFQVAQQVGPTRDAIAAVPVGVQVGSADAASQSLWLAAPVVGIDVARDAAAPGSGDARAAHVGVSVGTVAASIHPRTPDGFLKGSTGTITVTGHGLDAVTAVQPVGAGIAFGAPVASAGGQSLAIPVSVSGEAASGTYGLHLSTGSGTATARVSVLEPLLFSVGALPTALNSLSPIVLEQGKSYGFVVRGTNLRDVTEVFAEPSSGLVFGVNGTRPQWSSDALGEKLTVPLVVEAQAPVGSRAIRLRVPGGATDAQATPANTLTVVAPQ